MREPSNYYALSVGEEFVVMDGCALPLAGVLRTYGGRRQGNFYYLPGGFTGVHIRTRQATARELNALKTAPANKVAPALDLGDWK